MAHVTMSGRQTGPFMARWNLSGGARRAVQQAVAMAETAAASAPPDVS